MTATPTVSQRSTRSQVQAPSSPGVIWDMQAAMEQAGVSQDELATRLGTTRYRVRQLMARERHPVQETRYLNTIIHGTGTVLDAPVKRYETLEIVAANGEVKS